MPIYKENRANPNAIYFEESSLGWVYFEDKLVWQKEAISPEFIFTILLTGETEITLPLLDGYTYDFTVDWGDGSSVGTITAYDDADATHAYSGAGEYDITINGTCQCFAVGNVETGYLFDISQYITDIKQWGNCDFRLLNFAVCYNIITITAGKITGANNITSFRGGFTSCTSLTSMPDGLFDNCPNVTDFYWCFTSCTSLTSMPDGLFDNCPNVTDFSYCFWDCTSLTSMPDGLFDNCTLVTTFELTFSDCTSLDGNAPELWLRIPEPIGTRCFYNCTGLDNYASIPSDWK